jgi:hypothetical protein
MGRLNGPSAGIVDTYFMVFSMPRGLRAKAMLLRTSLSVCAEIPSARREERHQHATASFRPNIRISSGCR